MKLCHLTFRFLIPVGAALGLVIAAPIVDVSPAQARAAESAFKEQLTALAVRSRFMLHASAAAYCRSRGMVFHRVRTDRYPARGRRRTSSEPPCRPSARTPACHLSRTYPAPDGVPRMYRACPGQLQPDAPPATQPAA